MMASGASLVAMQQVRQFSSWIWQATDHNMQLRLQVYGILPYTSAPNSV